MAYIHQELPKMVNGKLCHTWGEVDEAGGERPPLSDEEAALAEKARKLSEKVSGKATAKRAPRKKR